MYQQLQNQKSNEIERKAIRILKQVVTELTTSANAGPYSVPLGMLRASRLKNRKRKRKRKTV